MDKYNEYFLSNEDIWLNKLNKKILINGLLCHQDIKPHCKIIHNRYKNAVQNMLYIIDILKLTGKRFLENFVF
jgi:hypothetical protein